MSQGERDTCWDKVRRRRSRKGEGAATAATAARSSPQGRRPLGGGHPSVLSRRVGRFESHWASRESGAERGACGGAAAAHLAPYRHRTLSWRVPPRLLAVHQNNARRALITHLAAPNDPLNRAYYCQHLPLDSPPRPLKGCTLGADCWWRPH